MFMTGGQGDGSVHGNGMDDGVHLLRYKVNKKSSISKIFVDAGELESHVIKLHFVGKVSVAACPTGYKVPV
eukprot:6742392-Pyramimonas_sp.AAC.1